MPSQPAIGAELLFGLGREEQFGIPAGSLTYFRGILPANLNLTRSETPGGEVNPSGFMEAGVPGPITGPFDVGVRFSAAHMLMPMEALGIEWTKSTADAGPPTIYEYEGVPSLAFYQSLWGLRGLPGVEKERFYGILLGAINMPIGDNTPLALRLQGQMQHGTRFPAPTADAGNTGSHAGPHLRGPLADEAAGGRIHVNVTAVSPLAFKVERRVSGSPTFPGTAILAVYDADGNGTWQNLPDEDGADLGYWDENKDPLEIVFPGTAAEHATDIDVGDEWVFDLAWADPTPTYFAGQRFTSAHAIMRYRLVGASTWIEARFQSGAQNLAWPAVPERGNASKYPYAIGREGMLNPTLSIVRKYTDRDFVTLAEGHKRLEMQIEYQGAQISADYALRESVLFDYPSVKVASARPVANVNAVPETLTLQAETNADGDPPVTITVTTEYNFTPSTGI